MIKINLLPKGKNNYKSLALKQIYTLSSIIIIIFILSSFCFTKYKIKNYKTEINELKAKEIKYNKTLAKINEIKQKKKKAENIINLIILLIEETPTMIKNIDISVKNIPKKKLYLTNYSYQDKIIRIKGIALNLEAVATYIDNLEKTKIFGKITLDGINIKKSKDEELTSFSISIFRKEKKKDEKKH